MKPDPRAFPDRGELVKAWLAAHFAGRVCVVFYGPLFEPPEFLEEVRRRFPKANYPDLINCQIAVRVCATLSEAIKMCNATPDCQPYTQVWDGSQIVHENT